MRLPLHTFFQFAQKPNRRAHYTSLQPEEIDTETGSDPGPEWSRDSAPAEPPGAASPSAGRAPLPPTRPAPPEARTEASHSRPTPEPVPGKARKGKLSREAMSSGCSPGLNRANVSASSISDVSEQRRGYVDEHSAVTAGSSVLTEQNFLWISKRMYLSLCHINNTAT